MEIGFPDFMPETGWQTSCLKAEQTQFKELQIDCRYNLLIVYLQGLFSKQEQCQE
jgi:hypothetical protein